MAKLYNLARMTTATTGTGTITLGAAVSGYLTFAAAGVANGDVVDYAIKDGATSEHGTGTYTSAGTTLTRTVTKSTNGNAAINLSGTAEVFISPRAETLNDGSLLTTGTVADARLSSNVPLKNGANTYTGLATLNTSGVAINTGHFDVGVGAYFTWPTAGSGTYQFSVNAGAGQTIVNPTNVGLPFWFLSSDAGGSGCAGYTLHRSGAYALNVGLDTDNNWKIGGWSDGNQYRVKIDSSGNLVARSSIYAGNGSGAFSGVNAAKAWVAFNGTTAGIMSAYNVSSITRNAPGDYTMNFTGSIGTTNYAVMGAVQSAGVAQGEGFDLLAAPTSPTSFRFRTVAGNGSATDSPYITAQVYST